MFYVIMTLLVDTNADFMMSRSEEVFSFHVWGKEIKPHLVENNVEFREVGNHISFTIASDNV